MKKKGMLPVSLVLAGLVLMVLGCTPRTNNPVPATVGTAIGQVAPTLGNGTEEYPAEIGGNHTAWGWIDLGVISIPPEWSYIITDIGPGYAVEISGEGASGSIRMAVWDVMVGDPYMIVNTYSSQQAFSFNDGRSGYMLKDHLSGSHHTLVLWLRHDSWIALSLYYDGDDSVFTENEELILRVARTLTDNWRGLP